MFLELLSLLTGSLHVFVPLNDKAKETVKEWNNNFQQNSEPDECQYCLNYNTGWCENCEHNKF